MVPPQSDSDFGALRGPSVVPRTKSQFGRVTPVYCMEFLWIASLALLDHTRDWVPDENRLLAESLLRSLDNPLQKCPAGDGLPRNPDKLGFADLWFPKMELICRKDPGLLLESNLLPAMIEFYSHEERTDIKPHTSVAELPLLLGDSQTWLHTLQRLAKDCEDIVARKAGIDSLLRQDVQASFPVQREDRRHTERESRLDTFDWSI